MTPHISGGVRPILNTPPPPAAIFWEASERQGELLSSDEFEVLYGGAAGGGKSDALLMDACCLQHGGIYNKNHRAVLFRRSFMELTDLIDRSKELYKEIEEDAVYNESKHIWTFPSGAKIEFGYLQHDTDRFKYRGRAWNYVGFDELTLWATPVCYLYLFTRCRSTDKTLPRYVRATTNPDGPGQKWVMERFAITRDGLATLIPKTLVDREFRTVTTRYRRFIPAKLSDNKHLDDTGYRENLLEQDEETQDALLLGLWIGTKTKGSYYLNEMAWLRRHGRICSVPHIVGVPVNTFWDLGMNDTTAIWFHQFIAGQDRFIGCYENSGEAFDHYAMYLQGLIGGDGKNPPPTSQFVYGRHYLPHDGGNRTLQGGKTNLVYLQGLLPGHRFDMVPRVMHVGTGINETRMKMRTNVVMDDVACADGIAALDQYQKRYIKMTDTYADEPLHNRYSNYADAFRQWGQGFMPRGDNTNDQPGSVGRPNARKAGQKRRGSGMSA